MDNKSAIKVIDNLLDHVTDSMHNEMKLGHIKVLFKLAEVGEQGLTIGQLADAIGYQQGSTSKLVGKMSCKKNLIGGQQWNLINLNIDEQRPKYKIVSLSSKGKRFVERMLSPRKPKKAKTEVSSKLFEAYALSCCSKQASH